MYHIQIVYAAFCAFYVILPMLMSIEAQEYDNYTILV